jgi:Tfp pilus assembly protein PilX
MGAEVLPGEKTPVGMRQGGATTAQEPRLALVARSEAMHGWRVFRIASASLWGHRGGIVKLMKNADRPLPREQT